MIKTLEILMILAAFFICWRIAMWALWYYYKDKSCPHVSYKSFREFYAVAPDNWYIGSDYLEYKGNRVELEKYRDLLKFRRFKKKLKKRGDELEKDRRQTKFIRDVQNDIDEYRKGEIQKMQMVAKKELRKAKRYYVLVKEAGDYGDYRETEISLDAYSKEDAENVARFMFSNCEILKVEEIDE